MLHASRTKRLFHGRSRVQWVPLIVVRHHAISYDSLVRQKYHESVFVRTIGCARVLYARILMRMAWLQLKECFGNR